jgi:hypothetical protein
MATVTTKAEQVRAGRLARQVGGYSVLIRLAGERERLARQTGEFNRDEHSRHGATPSSPRPREQG